MVKRKTLLVDGSVLIYRIAGTRRSNRVGARYMTLHSDFDLGKETLENAISITSRN